MANYLEINNRTIPSIQQLVFHVEYPSDDTNNTLEIVDDENDENDENNQNQNLTGIKSNFLLLKTRIKI